MSKSRLARRFLLPTAPLALAGVPAAKATIVYTNLIPDATILSNSGSSIYLDLNGGAGTVVSSSSFAGADLRLYFHPYGPVAVNANGSANNHIADSGGPYYFAAKFNAGGSISGRFTYSGTFLNQGGNGPWTSDGSHGYLGISFDIDGGGNYRNAWVQVSYNNAGSGNTSITVYDFAYETTPGMGINAGAIPEPSTYAALAGLLAGSAALYRRRKQKAQKQGIEESGARRQE